MQHTAATIPADGNGDLIRHRVRSTMLCAPGAKEERGKLELRQEVANVVAHSEDTWAKRLFEEWIYEQVVYLKQRLTENGWIPECWLG